MTIDERLLRAVHSSLTVRWGTSAPYAFGKVRCERANFAQDPFVELDVVVPDESLGSVIPVARQIVFGELAERGWPNTMVEFTPRVARGRRRRFVDQNEASESTGRNKMGVEHAIRFAIVKRSPLHVAAFPLGSGSYANLPENPHRPLNDCIVCDGRGCEFCPKVGP